MIHVPTLLSQVNPFVETVEVKMNDAYVLADFVKDNRQWVNNPDINVRDAEDIFFASLFDHEFLLEPVDGAAFTRKQRINVLLGGEHVFQMLNDTHIEYWIGTLNAIVQGERTRRGFIKQCVHNGSLKVVLQKFESDEYYKVFPEELDFTLDKPEDSILRSRGVNPGCDHYVEAVNARRIALGVKPYLPKSNSPQHHLVEPTSLKLLTSQEYMVQRNTI